MTLASTLLGVHVSYVLIVLSMLCDIVTFIVSETTSTTQALLKQQSKIHIQEDGKIEMATLKKVTKRSKEHQEDRDLISLKKAIKIHHEEPSTEEEALLRNVKKSEIVAEEMKYSEAVTEVKLSSSYEVTEDTWSYETSTEAEKLSKCEEKKKEYKDVREKKEMTLEMGVKEDKFKSKKETKIPKEKEPEIPQPTLKKVIRSIPAEKEQEAVKLKPVEKPDKAVAGPQKDSNIDRSKDSIGVQKHERLLKDEPLSKKKIEVAATDQQAEESVMPKLSVAKDEISEEPMKFTKKGRGIPPQDEKPETFTLKPFSKESQANVTAEKVPNEQKEKIDDKQLEKLVPHQKLKEPHIRVKEPGKSDKLKEETEKIKQLEPPHEYFPMKSTSTPEKTTQDGPKEEEKEMIKKHGIIPVDKAKKEEVSLKPVEGRTAEKTPSPKVDKSSPQVTSLIKKSPKSDDKPEMSKKIGVTPKKMEDKKEILLKPVELKKTPSPKAEISKPKPTEKIAMERKSSAKLPQKTSPKDSVESVILKKVPKAVSPKEEKTIKEPPLKTNKGKVPVVKELSPSVLELQKIPTQQEEVVYEHEQDAEDNEEEETWGWELTPRDSYGSETYDDILEDGVVETPGMGDKKGEMVTPNAHNWSLIAPYNYSK